MSIFFLNFDFVMLLCACLVDIISLSHYGWKSGAGWAAARGGA